jgi:hypothetical protein
MHQIQVSTPKGKGKTVAELALKVGIQQASVSQAYAYGPNEEQDQVNILTDTPSARKFLDSLMSASYFDPRKYNILSDNIPALVYSENVAKITQPFDLPVPNIYEELWSQNQVNPTYFAKVIVSSLLLSYGMIQNQILTMIAALLFTPFLTKVQGSSFGILTRQWPLALRGGLLLLGSTVLTVISGIIVALVIGGPLQYNSFSPLWINFLISLIVAVVAGFATADANGKRELIAMTAAAQFAVFPAWFGIMLVLGLPDADVVVQRWLTFLVNVITIFVVTIFIYYLMKYKEESLERFTAKTRPQMKKATKS